MKTNLFFASLLLFFAYIGQQESALLVNQASTITVTNQSSTTPPLNDSLPPPFVCGAPDFSSQIPTKPINENLEKNECGDDDIKFLRLNFHFMLPESTTGDQENFTEIDDGFGNSNFTGYDYANFLMSALNWSMRNNHIAGHPVDPLNPHPYPPKRIMYVLDGVYFHRNDYFSTIYSSSGGVNNVYGENIETVYNIYFTRGYVSSPSAYVASGLPAPAAVINKAWYKHQNPWESPEGAVASIADDINHELGHIWDLCHSFSEDNPCGDLNPGSNIDPDINIIENCDGTPMGNSCDYGNNGCGSLWTSGDNNFMGYNALRTSLTPCQLDILHETIDLDHSQFIAFCCEDWDYEFLDNPERTYITELCPPNYCELPEIVTSTTHCLQGCSVNYALAGFAEDDDVCVTWEFSTWNQNGTPGQVTTSDEFEITRNIPDGHSYQICMTICGEDCSDVTTCQSIQSCTVAEAPETVDFDFVYADNTLNSDREYNICEDVYINASASDLAVSHSYTLLEFVPNGDPIFIAQTISSPGNPAVPVNITQVFQTYSLFDENNDPLPSPLYFEGNTYVLRLDLDFGACGSMSTSAPFRIIENHVDFHFVQEDGTIDNNFDIFCTDTDVHFDASASDGPVTEHSYILWEVGENGVPFFIAWTNPPHIGDPDVPTNISDIFRNYPLSGSVPNTTVDNFEFDPNKIYRLQLLMLCGNDWVYEIREFTTYALCAPCPAEVPTIGYVQQSNGFCTFNVAADNRSNPCNSWEITRYSTAGDPVTTTHSNINTYATGSYSLGMVMIEVCVTYCGEDCEDSSPVCTTITEEMLRTCSNEKSTVNEFKAAENKLVVFPNPSIDELTLTSILAITGYTIVALNGQVLKKAEGESSTSLRIDISSLPSGSYHLLVTTTDGQTQLQKLVKL